MNGINKAAIKPFRQPCSQCLHAPACLLSPFSPTKWSQLSHFHFPTQQLQPHQALHQQSNTEKNIYIVRAGLLKTELIDEVGNRHITGFHMAPDCIGWAQTPQHQLLQSIVAITPSQVCVISYQTLNKLSEQHSQMTQLIIEILDKHQRYNNTFLLRKPACQRIAIFLLQLAERHQGLGYPSHQCPINMTHQDIANYLDLAPGTFSKHLRQLEKARYILLSKHQVTILDMHQFKKFAAASQSKVEIV